MKKNILLILFALPFLCGCPDLPEKQNLAFLREHTMRFQQSGVQHHAKYDLLTKSHGQLLGTMRHIKKLVAEIKEYPETDVKSLTKRFARMAKVIEDIYHDNISILEDAMAKSPNDQDLAVKAKMQIILARAYQSLYTLYVFQFGDWLYDQDIPKASKKFVLSKWKQTRWKIRFFGWKFRRCYEELMKMPIDRWDQKRLGDLKDDMNLRMLASRYWITRESEPNKFYRLIADESNKDTMGYFRAFEGRVDEITSAVKKNVTNLFITWDQKRMVKGHTPSLRDVMGRVIHFLSLRNEWYYVKLSLQNNFPIMWKRNSETETAFLIYYKAVLLAHRYTQLLVQQYRQFLVAEVRRNDPEWYRDNDDLSTRELLQEYIEENKASDMKDFIRALRLYKMLRAAGKGEKRIALYLDKRWYQRIKIPPMKNALVHGLFEEIANLRIRPSN